MLEQKQRARERRKAGGGWDSTSVNVLEGTPATEFVGYTALETEAKVIAIIVDGEKVDSVSEGDAVIVLDKTAFYGESGGQVGDEGVILCDKGEIKVVTTTKRESSRLIPVNRGEASKRSKYFSIRPPSVGFPTYILLTV